METDEEMTERAQVRVGETGEETQRNTEAGTE